MTYPGAKEALNMVEAWGWGVETKEERLCYKQGEQCINPKSLYSHKINRFAKFLIPQDSPAIIIHDLKISPNRS